MSNETPPGADGGRFSPATDRRSPVCRPGGRRDRKDVRFGRRRQRRTRILRASLLVLLVAGMGGLALVFLDGRPERTAAIADEAVEEATGSVKAAAAGEETVQLSAEQFESTLEREGVEVFRIRGARTSSDDQGNVLLKEVDVDYPYGDDHFRLRADAATYNEVTNATHLEGAVALEGTNGLTVETSWMDLARGGMILTAADDSRFTLEGMTAVGDGLRVDFRQEGAFLRNGVRANGIAMTSGTGAALPPLSLTADRLEYRWREGWMKAAGAAVMEFGQSPEPLSVAAARLDYRVNEGVLSGRGGTTTRFGDVDLEAGFLTLSLARGSADSPTLLQARRDIVLQAPLGSGGLQLRDGEAEAERSTLILRGAALDVAFDINRLPSRLMLSSPKRTDPGVLRVDHGDGTRRRVRAEVLVFDFVDGVPSGFEARGRVVLDEQAPQRRQPLRVASSSVARGRFDSDGALTELVLEGNVELTDRSRDPVHALADRAEIDTVSRRVVFLGGPGKLVLADGELDAPRTVLDQVAGCSEASGGVVITLRNADENDAGLPRFAGADSADGPSTIRAREALVCNEGDSRFQGEVETLAGGYGLAAAQLRVSRDRKRLVATGDVRTTWRPLPESGPANVGEMDLDATGEEWLVVSERMILSEDGGELRYSGNVSASLGDRRLGCDELTIEAATEAGDGAQDVRARVLHCLGNARFRDVSQEISAGADRALYAADEGVIRLTGAIVIHDGRDLLKGPELVYWFDEGRYEMGPSGSAPAGVGSP